MATSPTDKSVKDEEEEVRTEENDPAKTSDEEDEVRTEEDVVRTEQDEVRTEEDVVRTEQDEVRTEEVDAAKTTEKTEDEVRTEEEDEPKEEAIESLVDSARNITTTENEESDQGTDNQNRQEDPITVTNDPSLDQTRGSDQRIDHGSTSLTSDQNRRLDSDQGAANQNPQEESITTRRSGQAMVERGSTSSARDQNRSLVLPNPSGAQMSQAMMPPLLGPSVPPHQQDQSVSSLQNHPLGLPQPRWLVVDHFYSDGLGLYGEQWRFRTIIPLHPNQNNTYLLHQLIMMELPHQPGPVLVAYNRSFGVLQQDRLVPHVQAPPPIRPPPMMQQQQSPFLSVPPLRPLMPQDEFVVYLGQVPVRPMMYYQEQHQIVPNPGAGIGQQAPVRPPVVTYNQGQIGHSRGQLEAPMWQPPVRMCSPSPIVNVVPVRPMMNYNQQQFNQGQQRFRFPVNMIQHNLPSPSAASAVRPRPGQNQQLHPQAQQPWEWESQGSNDGPSSPGESEG